MGYFESLSPGFTRQYQILRGVVMFPYAFPLWLVATLIKKYVEEPAARHDPKVNDQEKGKK